MPGSEAEHYTQLRDAIIREYGQRRAIDDWSQIVHIAQMLTTLDDWLPASYPDGAVATVADTDTGHDDGN